MGFGLIFFGCFFYPPGSLQFDGVHVFATGALQFFGVDRDLPGPKTQ